MSDTSITTIVVAFFACLPPSLIAWAALRSSKVNTVKADALMVKTAEIHTATNGTLSALNKSLDVAMEKISGLEKLVSSLTKASGDHEKK